jgi:hypothetical protein
MFLALTGLKPNNLGQKNKALKRTPDNWYITNRGVKKIGFADGQSVEGYPVRGAQKHHSGDAVRRGCQPGVCAGGNRSGVDIPGMGDNQRFGWRPTLSYRVEITCNHLLQTIRIGRIEKIGYRGLSDHTHIDHLEA